MSTLDEYMKRFAQMQSFNDQKGTQGGGNPAQSINEPGGQVDGDWMDRSRWLNGTGGGRQAAPGWQPPGGPPMVGPPAQWQPPGGQMGYAPQVGPTSIYDVFQSAVPLMNANRDQQIGQSMAQAGMQGTRFGTASENNVARIGADTALQQDQMLTNLLYQQGQADADRSLQASQQAIGLSNAYDQMQRNRIDTLAQLGMWEQGRGDALNMLPYQDFMQSRMGYLPYVLNAMSGTGAPAQQAPITTNTPGSPGLWDYLMQGGMTAAMMYGAFSDERLKDDIIRHDTEVVPGVPLATWRWKHNGRTDAGVIAQDLEKVRPDLVQDVKGYKFVNYGGLR